MPNKRIIKKIQVPISNVRDLQILTNLGLVHRLAQKYKQYCNNTSVTYSDLVQEGTIGLMIAKRKYDPTKGARFSTYANYWIRAKIIRLLQRHYSTIHVTYSASAEYDKLIKKYGSAGGVRGHGFQSLEELIDKVTVDYRKGKITEANYKKYVDILQARSPLNYTHISLDVLIDEEDTHKGMDNRKLGFDLSKRLAPVDNIEQILSRKSVVAKLFEDLEPDEARLIKLYHGLEDGKERTYKELAEIFKCSKQKAHQWYQRIIKKMRTKLKDEICYEDEIDPKELFSEN